MARNRFERFDEIGGQRYLYAHWLTDDPTKEQFPLHWVTGLKEPRLFVRWGVAVALTAPEDYRDPPPVIGSGDASSGNAGNPPSRPGAGGRGAPVGGGRGAGLSPPGGVSGGGVGGGVGGGAGSESLTSPRGSLLYCSGDFGARLLQRFEMRRTASPPYFGPIVASLDTAPASENTPAGGGGRMSGVPDFSSFGGAAPSTTNPNSDGKQWTSPNSQFTAGTLLPGVFFLGVDDGKSDKQFVEIGKQVGLDALIVVLVDVNTRRNRPATSNVGAVVYNLKTGESQKTSLLNNETVAKLREKSTDAGDDPIEKELDKLFAKFSDVQLRINDLPDLKPEAVVKRVGAISTETQPLAGIVEVVSYWRANLVDDATAMNFITDATNEELAKALLNGTDDERKKALTAWLEAHQEKPIEAANSFR